MTGPAVAPAFAPVRSPARPGPGPTPEALLRALDVTIGRRIRGLVPGEFRAHELGGGTELAQVRPYEPGDDVRRIDWNVTARMATPHVRVHVPERSLTTWLLLDESPSMTFGTADRRKADVAEGVAMAIGHLSTRHGNRLGVLTFGGPVDRRIGAARRPGGAARRPVCAVPERRRAGHPRRLVARDRAAVRGRRCRARRPRGPRLRLPRAAGLASAARGSRGAPPAPHGRDPRSARGRAHRRGRPDPRRQPRPAARCGSTPRPGASATHFAAEAAAGARRRSPRELGALGARHIVLSTSGSWLRSLAAQLRTRGLVA